MIIRKTEHWREYTVKEFVVDDQILEDWGVTHAQVLAYVAEEDIDDEVFDIISDMFETLDYDIYDEDTHHDGEDWHHVTDA